MDIALLGIKMDVVEILIPLICLIASDEIKFTNKKSNLFCLLSVDLVAS